MKKLRLKKPFKLLLLIIIIFIILFLYSPVTNILKLVSKEYSISSSIAIYKLNLHDRILEDEYSEFLDKCIKDKSFDLNNLDIYLDLDYQNRDNFVDNVNSMITLKYDIDEINKIYSNVSDYFLSSVILKEYVYDIGKYLDVDIFKEENFKRYKAYFNGNYAKTVLYVNIGLDKEYYTDVIYNDNFSTTMIVNKYYGVSKNFVAPDLTRISDDCSKEEHYLSREAADAFEKMCRAAKKEGYSILANSTYRDFDEQQELWDLYLKLYGQSYNDKYVTKPGFSEHHTGLAIDIKSANSNIFKNSKEYTWTTKNSYKYGFIHRYQESKVDITGIASEAWHFRYVGVDVATYMYENNLSFEEYYALFLDK